MESVSSTPFNDPLLHAKIVFSSNWDCSDDDESDAVAVERDEQTVIDDVAESVKDEFPKVRFQIKSIRDFPNDKYQQTLFFSGVNLSSAFQKSIVSFFEQFQCPIPNCLFEITRESVAVMFDSVQDARSVFEKYQSRQIDVYPINIRWFQNKEKSSNVRSYSNDKRSIPSSLIHSDDQEAEKCFGKLFAPGNSQSSSALIHPIATCLLIFMNASWRLRPVRGNPVVFDVTMMPNQSFATHFVHGRTVTTNSLLNSIMPQFPTIVKFTADDIHETPPSPPSSSSSSASLASPSDSRISFISGYLFPWIFVNAPSSNRIFFLFHEKDPMLINSLIALWNSSPFANDICLTAVKIVSGTYKRNETIQALVRHDASFRDRLHVYCKRLSECESWLFIAPFQCNAHPIDFSVFDFESCRF